MHEIKTRPFHRFPFHKLRPQSEQCFFVADSDASARTIRSAARAKGFRVRLKRAIEHDSTGVYVWVRATPKPAEFHPINHGVDEGEQESDGIRLGIPNKIKH